MIGRAARFIATATVLLLPAGLLAVTVQAFPEAPEELQVPPEAIWAEPSTGTFEDATAVTVQVTFGAPDEIVSPGWDGIVTSALIEPGEVVAGGQIIALVAESPVVAMATPRPFSRDLRRGDEGPDVQMLQEMLISVGFVPGVVDGKFGSGTGRAVEEWRTVIGTPDPDAGFVLAEVVWLPREIQSVFSTTLEVGGTAPEAGEVVLVGERQPSGTEVVDDASSRPINDTEGLSLSIGDIELGELSEAGISEGQLAQLSAAIATGEISTSTTPGSDARDDSAVPKQADTQEYQGVVRTAEPAQSVAVPGSAVIEGQDGTACVYARTDGERPSPMRVTVERGELDTVFLDPETAPSSQVLVNPLEVIESASCE